MSEEAARKLYREAASAAARLDASDSNFKETAEKTRARLKELSIALYPCYQKALDAGDVAHARAIDDVMSSIEVLRVSIGKALIRELDNSPDVKAACEKIGAINEKLEKAATDAEETAAHLDRVTGTLGELTTLVGWVKERA